MFNIDQARRQRGEINAKVQALATKQQAEGSLSEDELTEFGTLKKQFDDLTQQINAAEDMEKLNATHAAPVANAGNGAPVIAKQKAKDYPGAKLSRLAMSVGAAGGDMGRALSYAKNLNDDNVVMALETSSGSGGALVPQSWTDEVIELLTPKTIVLALGAQEIPLVNGSQTIPRLTSGSTSTFKGEGEDTLATGVSFDDVELQAKELITLVPVSNKLLAASGVPTERLVLNDMLGSMGRRLDKAALRDDGTGSLPTGFRQMAIDGSRTIAWSGTADVATIDAYLNSLILQTINSDSMLIAPGWGFAPRTWMKLKGLRDGNGNKVYPEMDQGMLKGYPLQNTNTIPSNLGAGTNESEIYFGDWNDVLIGQDRDQGMVIDFSREATYKDDGGNLVSAFARNQSLLRVVNYVDVGFRHIEGLSVGTGVTW